jgi:uncharacterized protein YqeY
LLRERLAGALKDAIESSDRGAAGTLRLILAALKERDHCAREAGATEGVSDAEIVAMLRAMIEQRRQDIPRCEKAARVDLAEQEASEIAIIEQFLPQPMSTGEVQAAVERAISELGASKLKDCGRVISALKERYNGQMDFASAKRLVCERLH